MTKKFRGLAFAAIMLGACSTTTPPMYSKLNSATSTTTALFQQERAKGYFEGDLVLKDVAADYPDAEWTEFELIQDYAYVDRLNRKWTVPATHVVNGASIPKEVWSVVGGPWSGRYRNASVIHDYMCDELIESSDFTHKLFFQMLIDSDVPRLKSQIMYGAVKQFGPQWESGDGFLPPDAQPIAPVDQDEFDAMVREVGSQTMSVQEIDAYIESRR